MSQTAVPLRVPPDTLCLWRNLITVATRGLAYVDGCPNIYLSEYQMLIRAKPKTFWCSPHIKEKYNANISILFSLCMCPVSCVLKYLILATALTLTG